MKSLKYNLLLLCFLSLGLFSAAQDVVTRALPPFTGISVIGKLRVELYKSDTSRVDLVLENVAAENIITEVKDSVLSIRMKTDTNKSAVIKVLVYYSNLTEITVASNALLLSPDTLVAEKIKFTARIGAKMELDLNVSNLVADVKQGGILVFSGKTTRQEVTVNTGATYSAYTLESEDSYVTANSGSKAKVCAARIIDASSNTKSYIGYIGVPISVYIKTNLGGVIASFANADAVFED